MTDAAEGSLRDQLRSLNVVLTIPEQTWKISDESLPIGDYTESIQLRNEKGENSIFLLDDLEALGAAVLAAPSSRLEDFEHIADLLESLREFSDDVDSPGLGAAVEHIRGLIKLSEATENLND